MCIRDRYGIGRSSSAKILDKAGVDKDLKVKDWTDDQAAKIREIIGAEYKVEGLSLIHISFTVTTLSFRVTVTPAGILMGNFPILDILIPPN